MERIFLSILLLACTASAHAGSGFYYGFDALSHSLDTFTETEIIFTPPPPDTSTSRGERIETFTDYGLRLGYKHKRRKTHRYFMAPEFYITSFDPGDLIYGTNLKIGYEFNRYTLFGVMGISHIDLFDKKTPNFGLGGEYNMSDTLSINLEWQRINSTEEQTTADANFGAQVITTNTDTQRDIDVIKLGISFYFHE